VTEISNHRPTASCTGRSDRSWSTACWRRCAAPDRRPQLREKELLKEFAEYRAATQRKLKVFRLEAVRAGFRKAWQEKDYAAILEVARKIPEDVLQEDDKLVMWYDQAVTRTGSDL